MRLPPLLLLRRRRLLPARAPPPPQGEASGASDALVSGCEAVAADLRELAAVQPATGSFFVRLFLGQVNVKVASPRDRETLRDEYNKFKDRTNLGVIGAGLVWALTLTVLQYHLRFTGWIFTLTHLWLLYYYISLALRENILRMVRAAPRLRAPAPAARCARAPAPRTPSPRLPPARRTARPSGRGGSSTITCRR